MALHSIKKPALQQLTSTIHTNFSKTFQPIFGSIIQNPVDIQILYVKQFLSVRFTVLCREL